MSQSPPNLRRPNLFIVGAPRCGTGSLWTYLKQHPDVFMSIEKELYFFDTDLRASGWQRPPLDTYLANFAAAGHRKIAGEATPSYLRSECAAREIKAFSPEAKIVMMLRNPVDVMHSLHSAALYGREPLTDFESAIAADSARRAPDLIGYREFTDFPRQVQRYFDVFSRESVHTIIFDDLKADPAAVYRKTLEFLNVDTGFKPEFTIVNANAAARNPRLQQSVASPPRGLRQLARALLPPRLRASFKHSLLDANLIATPRAPMDPEVRRRLQKESEPQVLELSNMLGRDLSAWSRWET